MIPIISVVGKSGCGKTTLLEKLIIELKQRGYRLAVVKHHAHPTEVDTPGKDSWRFSQAGADVALVASPSQLVSVRGLEHELALDEIAALLPDMDLILTEGYQRGPAPKVEVFRHPVSDTLLCHPDELFALVTDQRFEMPIPQFALDDAAGLADLIEARFLS